MRFKPGDLVIKNTGGNKMRIVSYKDDEIVDCVWITDNINEGVFNEGDLVSMNEFKSLLATEKRDDMINNILKD